jgi:Mrp family chromosome partitioning ATPase
MPRFVFLPAGRYPVVDSAELLASKALQQLTDEMKQRYPDRIVVVDLPPLLDTADALAFLPQADTTLLVVEEHTTSVADLENSAELLAPFNLIGCVLSQPPGDDGPPEVRRWINRWLARGGRSRA